MNENAMFRDNIKETQGRDTMFKPLQMSTYDIISKEIYFILIKKKLLKMSLIDHLRWRKIYWLWQYLIV